MSWTYAISENIHFDVFAPIIYFHEVNMSNVKRKE